MTIFLTFVDYTLLMKVKLIECTHELEYSFSCLIEYDDKGPK